MEQKMKNEDPIALLGRKNAMLRKVIWALILSMVIELMAMIFVALH
jgi:hypothetical protein